MSKSLKDVIQTINVLQAIQTLEHVSVNGKNESARVAAAFKLLEIAGVSKGEGSLNQVASNFYKQIIGDDDEPRDQDQLEEVG